MVARRRAIRCCAAAVATSAVAILPNAVSAQRAVAEAPACRPVATSTRKWPDDTLKRWVGEYTLHVIATQGRYSTDSVARGRLSLWVTDAPHASIPRQPGMPPATFPVTGATDVPIARLAPVTIAVPLTSRDPAKPGVQLFDGRLMWMGAPFTREGSFLDAGVQFEIDSVAPDGLRGYWVEGGRHMLHGRLPAGYFCAFRRGAPASRTPQAPAPSGL